MKQLLSIALVLFLTNNITYSQSNVLFGERHLTSNRLSVCFDKDGNIYPDYFISDISLKNASASLSDWYKTHPADLKSIAIKYKCLFDDYSPGNIITLNDSIAATILAQINNNNTLNIPVTFLIHGFRKSWRRLNGDYTSPEDFEILEKTIARFTKKPGTFVEIYWDGFYDCCFSANTKRNDELFQLFDKAQNNAVQTGKAFRSMLTGIKKSTINIVTHSLGAKIAVTALFDSYANFDILTAGQQVNLCLIAPAIGGTEVFKNYYRRHSFVNYKANDNYRLAVIYNENDFVLKKRDNKIGYFGPGPYKHGNTSLGCNYDGAAIKLKEYFKNNYPHSAIELFNLSVVGKFHHLRNYCAGDNLKKMVEWMER